MTGWHPVRVLGIPVIIAAVALWWAGLEGAATLVLVAWIILALGTLGVLAWREAMRRLGR